MQSWHVYELLTVDCIWDCRRLSFDGWETTFTWEPENDLAVRDFIADHMTFDTTERFAREQLLENLPDFLIETEDTDSL